MSEPLRRPRRYLGRVQTLSERLRTYWTDEALEVDLADNYEIRRRRVFFDEILLVTLHRRRRGLLASLLPLTLALVLAVAALATSAEPSASRFYWAGMALFGGLALALALAPIWVVTVYGKRTRARMHFWFRQAKAREIYAEICRAADDAQRALAHRLAEEIPVPPPPPPSPISLPLSDSEIPPSPEEPPA